MTSDPHRPGRPSETPRSEATATKLDPVGDARGSTLGRRGEELAAAFFAARGYQIVARNVRADRVELDLIVRRGDLLAFVEVKTRRGARHGEAAEAVDPRKQRRLRRGARAWLASRPREAQGVRRHRFDVVTCVLLGRRSGSTGEDAAIVLDAIHSPDGTCWSIEHWESAF